MLQEREARLDRHLYLGHAADRREQRTVGDHTGDLANDGAAALHGDHRFGLDDRVGVEHVGHAHHRLGVERHGQIEAPCMRQLLGALDGSYLDAEAGDGDAISQLVVTHALPLLSCA